MRFSALVCVGLAALVPCASADAQITRSATSAASGGLSSTIDLFRQDLGQLNPYVPRSLLTGRREINWDDLHSRYVAPNYIAGDHYNVVSPRGLLISTPGTGIMISVPDGIPGGVLPNFGNINTAYLTGLSPYSTPSMMAAMGSTRTTFSFVIPGSSTPALSRGFGAVLSDVDEFGPTRIQYFDEFGALLLDLVAPATRGEATFSFIGATFKSPVVASVRIIAGTVPVNNTSGSVFGLPTVDVVAIDDLIFGEPVPAPAGSMLIVIAALVVGRRRR